MASWVRTLTVAVAADLRAARLGLGARLGAGRLRVDLCPPPLRARLAHVCVRERWRVTRPTG